MTVIRRIYLDLLQYLCRRESNLIADDLVVEINGSEIGGKIRYDNRITLLSPQELNNNRGYMYMADLRGCGLNGLVTIRIDDRETRRNMSIINQLENAAKKAGLWIEKKDDHHYHILGGAMIVSYYPFSKKQTAYVCGTRRSATGVTPREAVAMAGAPPPFVGTVKRNRKHYQLWRRKLWKKQGKLCHWCGMPMMRTTMHDPNSVSLLATIEHVIPLARGGLDNANNIVLAHLICNTRRGHDMPEIENECL